MSEDESCKRTKDLLSSSLEYPATRQTPVPLKGRCVSDYDCPPLRDSSSDYGTAV